MHVLSGQPPDDGPEPADRHHPRQQRPGSRAPTRNSWDSRAGTPGA